MTVSADFEPGFASDWERWAETYDSDPELVAITSVLDLEGKEILEPGMGSGRLSFRLAEVADSNRHVAFDRRPEMARYCESKHGKRDDAVKERLSFLAADTTDMPFPAKSFDTVIDAWVGYREPRAAAREERRVLSDGGKVFLIRYWPESEYDRIFNRFLDEAGITDLGGFEAEPEAYRKVFGEPVEDGVIRSGYNFDSVDEMYDSIDFHITEYLNAELEEDSGEQLKTALKVYDNGQDGQGIVVPEQCTYYVFQKDGPDGI